MSEPDPDGLTPEQRAWVEAKKPKPRGPVPADAIEGARAAVLAAQASAAPEQEGLF